ncbi:alcohol dehydrogenase catalytic domain-containing protein [Micromonospora sp. L5]|uniref:alcohol dehydrogenase catalytic domain-containing protein n=1 Tax=Micromonospora TaxID=1873 RepID=UPI0001C44C07
MRALLARGVDQPLTVEEVELPDPGPGEVWVRVRAAGVCHSDLSMVNGTLAPPYPLVLGHEAAGGVIEVGPGVDRVRPGTHVVLNWAPPCRRC